jgi:formylglycine-generating enzyme required for sulfatase activity
MGRAAQHLGTSTRGARVIALAVIALAACSEAPAVDGDAGVDAAIEPPDSSTAVPDAGDPEGDSGGEAPDGGIDGDGDGIQRADDCDDADPDVGSTATRACTSSCGAGLERCTDGAWGACDAPTECACTTIGMTRTVPCGRCGLASQTCQTDLTWSVPTECLGESECFEGDIEREMEMCGERARICDATCHWREWTEVAPPGECEAGVVMRTTDGCGAGLTRELSCSAACAWAESRPCEAVCTRPALASRSGADPVCIPAGPFVLGSDEPASTVGSRGRPERRVILSEYYIDRYPVTRARYEMCLADGACPAATGAYVAYYEMHPSDSFPGSVPPNAGEAFCLWDGGTLVTEFQWEKAARGVYPDRRLHSWGADGPDPCRTHPAPACPDGYFPITASQFPDAVSPYGVRLMGSLLERTSTPFSTTTDTHDWIADDTVDPLPPTTSALRVVRGLVWFNEFYQPFPGSSVRREGANFPTRAGFRCAY